ncbi:MULTISPECIES: TMEM175 family protein [Glycomyces]|uniref:Membrane protein n=2 Tax=Glycomyces TaxID=58113 RepID=A0A9X3PXV0_9ACTN|nr:TMEM175 family protein [Glycomyces lechevalierae]MDA1388043.1 TMEM175 family protein [Glycomyces lechevalierae]MDR7338786.1 putative membrane protein [Glycomyces lechevalierae]
MEKPHGLERMIFFSDAVIAIMLTLLALELPVPEGDTATALWESLSEHGAAYLAFGISFAVIAATWVAHHMLFTHVHRADPPLITLNLLALLAYVLVPWASKTLAESTGGAGVALYSAVMAFLGLSMLLVLRHVRRAGLLGPETPAAVIGGIRAWTVTTMLMFALTIPAAFFFGRPVMFVWPVVYLGLRLAAVLYTRQGRRATVEKHVEKHVE